MSVVKIEPFNLDKFMNICLEICHNVALGERASKKVSNDFFIAVHSYFMEQVNNALHDSGKAPN